MMKKILTLEDLYRVFEEKHLTHFSAEESGFRIVVSTPGQFELDGSDNEGLLPVTLKACHTGVNRNNSYI